MTISELWTALKIGKEIKNPATWKNRQSATNCAAAILALVVAVLSSMGIDINMSQADQVTYGGALMSVVGLINLILTAITSKKVGLPVSK